MTKSELDQVNFYIQRHRTLFRYAYDDVFIDLIELLLEQSGFLREVDTLVDFLETPSIVHDADRINTWVLSEFIVGESVIGGKTLNYKLSQNGQLLNKLLYCTVVKELEGFIGNYGRILRITWCYHDMDERPIQYRDFPILVEYEYPIKSDDTGRLIYTKDTVNWVLCEDSKFYEIIERHWKIKCSPLQ